MAERLPPVRIEQRSVRHAVIERLAKWHRKADVQGLENIAQLEELLKAGAPGLLVVNHLSHLDGPFIAVEIKNFSPEITHKLTLVMGDMIRRNFITRYFMHAYPGILIPSQRLRPEKYDARAWEEREKRKESAYKAEAEDLAGGRVIGVFFEGSRSREKQLGKVSPNNARHLKLVPDENFVPIGLWNTEKVYPPDTKLILPPRFWRQPHISIGRPISIHELEDRIGESTSEEENNQKLVDELMREVAKLLPPEYRGYYGDSKA